MYTKISTKILPSPVAAPRPPATKETKSEEHRGTKTDMEPSQGLWVNAHLDKTLPGAVPEELSAPLSRCDPS